MPVQYKQFRIGELFNLDRTRKTLNAQDLTIYEAADDGLYPYVVRQSRNNGIKGYVFVENQEWLNPGNTISFAQDTAEMFYQSNPYVTGNNMRVMTIQGHNLTEEIALFLISALRKTFSSYSWGMSFRKEVLDNEKISLPVTPSGTPDWDYMQEYISELEQERVSELEKYLAATGLDDYELTDDDREVLEISGFRRDEGPDSAAAAGLRKEMREFRMDRLFEFKAIKQAKSQALIPTDNNGVVYVVQSTRDNMMSRRVNKDWLVANNESPVPGNAIVLGVTLPAVSYQPFEFGASQVIVARSKCMTEEIGVFLVGILNQQMAQFSYTKKPGLAIYKSMSIPLPICTDAANNPVIDPAKTYHPDGYVPDWDFMSRYIRAIEKMVVKDVVDYKDEFIARTKAIV